MRALSACVLRATINAITFVLLTAAFLSPAAAGVTLTGANPSFFSGPGQVITFNFRVDGENAVLTGLQLVNMNHPPLSAVSCTPAFPIQPFEVTNCTATYTTQPGDTSDITQYGSYTLQTLDAPRGGAISGQVTVQYLPGGTPPPTIASLSPSSNHFSGGNTVTINGTNFTAPAQVLIDGTAAATVSLVSSTEIHVVMPPKPAPHSPATSLSYPVDVQVETPGGTSAALTYTYTNSPPAVVDHHHDMVQGGFLEVPVPGVLTGASDPDGDTFRPQFMSDPTPSLSFFAGVNGDFHYVPPPAFFGVTSFTYRAADEWEAQSALATVTIRVDPSVPVVNTVTAGSGPLAGGTSVTITGANFLGATGVSFGGVAAAGFAVVNATTITAAVPPGAAPGPVEVAVHKVNDTPVPPMNVSGTLAGGFTYLAPGALSVSDGDGLSASGPAGGTFTPASKTWTLANTGDEDIVVAVTATGGFFDLGGATSGAPFTLAAGASQDVTATFNAAAGALPAGLATGSIAFVNNTNGDGDTSRAVELTVEQHVTALALSSSPNPSVFGEEVVFTATLSGGFGATGTVEFFAGGTSLGTPPLTGGTTAVLATGALPVGDHVITAVYSGDVNNAGVAADPLTQTVGQIGTTLSLSSSLNPSNLGDEVTFTATVTPGTGGGVATGTVQFAVDGQNAGAPVALAGGTASLATSALGPGDHAITAAYSGDAVHAGSTGALTQAVRALGAVVVRQVAGGSQDASFGFTSPTPALNLGVTTSGGVGESAAVPLPAGSYAVTGADMSAAGFALVSLACSDADSIGNVETRTASIVLSPGETVTCTFTSVNAREDTLETIASFMQARAGILMANQPDPQRRIDRLNGTTGSGGNPISSLMAYLPGLVEGSTLSMSGSLAQIERLADGEKQSRFDAWASLTHGRYSVRGADGRFTLGAVGADWLISSDLLAGGFVQIDHVSQGQNIRGGTIGGTGWLAGPYLTARLSQNLYLDLLAAGGRSANSVSPYGTYSDDFAATRFMTSAMLQGQWTSGAWTFSPRARLSWFRERSDAYVDSLGVAIPQVAVETGQFAFGPGVSYRFDTEADVAVDTSLRFDAVAEFAKNPVTGNERSVHGRVEASLGLAFPGGARLSLSASHDGIGRSGTSSTAGRISVNVPLN